MRGKVLTFRRKKDRELRHLPATIWRLEIEVSCAVVLGRFLEWGLLSSFCKTRQSPYLGK